MKFLFILLAATMLLSCQEDPIQPNPPASSSAFSFYVNGTYHDNSEYILAMLSFGQLQVTAFDNTNDTDFIIELANTTTGTFPLTNTPTSVDQIRYHYNYQGTDVYLSSMYASQQGTLTITSIDQTAHTITGTFSGKVANSSGTNEVTITNGQFSMPYSQ